MPHLRALIGTPGVVLRVSVGITDARRNALVAAKRSVPSPIVVALLVDTGASMTAIDVSLVQRLGLQPTGTIGMNTPTSGAQPIQCSTYDVDLQVTASAAVKHIRAMPVCEADFSAQGHQGLLGRDFLSDFRMFYSGPDGLVMLSY